jgi:protein-L-isoaspartate(D-aspartate) O-methyltransferase
VRWRSAEKIAKRHKITDTQLIDALASVSLKDRGRLIMTLTTDDWEGQILKVTRISERYAAALLGPRGFIPCINARDPAAEASLARALKSVKSLKRNDHRADESCWMHCDGFCLSRRDLN